MDECTTRVSARGYVVEYRPGHPMAARNGWAYQHRVVMMKLLGRPLLKTEVVHHKNGVKTDNRLENLELMTARQHVREHHAHPKKALTDARVMAALRGRTAEEAAHLLGICRNTLRKRYRKFQRRHASPFEIDAREEEIRRMSKLHPPYILGPMLGYSKQTVYDAFRRWRERDDRLGVPARPDDHRPHSTRRRARKA